MIGSRIGLWGLAGGIAWLSFLSKENELLEGVDMKNKRDTKMRREKEWRGEREGE